VSATLNERFTTARPAEGVFAFASSPSALFLALVEAGRASSTIRWSVNLPLAERDEGRRGRTASTVGTRAPRVRQRPDAAVEEPRDQSVRSEGTPRSPSRPRRHEGMVLWHDDEVTHAFDDGNAEEGRGVEDRTSGQRVISTSGHRRATPYVGHLSAAPILVQLLRQPRRLHHTDERPERKHRMRLRSSSPTCGRS
jgi:hypothetical protein